MAKITRKYLDCDVVAYNQIAPRFFSYHHDSEEEVQPGTICMLPFGKRSSLAIIRKVSNLKPKFDTLPIIKLINSNTPISNNLLLLADWLKTYYVATNYQVYTTILPSNLNAKSNIITKFDINNQTLKLNTLTPEQSEVFKTLSASTSKPILLHGTTGSGKTELYLHLIDKATKLGKSSILLVPEIFLSTQLSERVKSHFQNVIITHSALTPAVRKSQWLYMQNSSSDTPLVIVGPRSAIFAPVKNLSTIIIDEEHEPSYKQESGLRYDTITTAAKRAQLESSTLVLGSATPSLRTHFLTTKDKIAHAILPGRFLSQLPEISVVDMKNTHDLISEELNSAITKNLASKRQVLLLLNRRGSSQALVCQDCHYFTRCNRCDIAMHYHADKNRLLCHYCNSTQLPPSSCPQCGSLELKHIGYGTKKLESSLKSKFPDANIVRIDRDNSDWQFLQSSYKSLKSGEIDIIVGTQMISRGLDVAGIELVGVIDADSSLQIADFSSSERCFQLLTQVAGRSGRRKTRGRVIIQTKLPSHEVIAAVKDQDYHKFVKAELTHRRKFAYPPYVYLLKLWSTQKNYQQAHKAALELSNLLTNKNHTVLGPAPKSATTNSMPAWQIIVKSHNRAELQNIISILPSKWKYEFDPITLT